MRGHPTLRNLALGLIGTLLAGVPGPTHGADDSLARGQYLVDLLGCGRCHTQGYLTGNEATGPYLAGSTLGIAYTAYSEHDDQPGIVFAGNLTSDPETGLGDWSEAEIIRAMTSGIAKGGHERLIVMPWPNYTALTADDLAAIAKFLKALPPVARRIPDPIPEGADIQHPYVRFGVYQFHPHGSSGD